MFDRSELKKLRGWEHIQKFVLGNVEAELALSMVLLDAIVLGKEIEKRERETEIKKAQREIREASEGLRVARQPSHAATATPAKQS